MVYDVNKDGIEQMADNIIRAMFTDGKDAGLIYFDVEDKVIRYTGFVYAFDASKKVIMSTVSLDSISSRMRFTTLSPNQLISGLIKEANLLHKLLNDNIEFRLVDTNDKV